jgi:hypothetical protein
MKNFDLSDFDIVNLAGGTASAATGPSTFPKVEDIIAAMQKIREQFALPDLEEWMRLKGFPPETSYLLLPSPYEKPGRIYPEFVRFARFIPGPTLIQRHLIDIGPPFQYQPERKAP